MCQRKDRRHEPPQCDDVPVRRTGLFFFGQVRAQQSNKRRFGAVGDHLDCVSERFPQRAQLAWSFVEEMMSLLTVEQDCAIIPLLLEMTED